MNFILNECTFLRYFIPLTIEGNKKNLVSNYFIYNSGKYNCPSYHKPAITELSKQHNFNIHQISDIASFPGLTFLIEGVGGNYLNDNHKDQEMY